MRNTKYLKYSFVCILTCFLMLAPGCTPREFCGQPEDMQFEEIPPLTPELKADIYYDASYSMVGFVNPGNSYYVRTLQLLERSFISGWPESTTEDYQYYQFGTTIDRISRDKALNAVFAEFYNDPDFLEETRIEYVIDKVDKGNLTIIITDLFQNAADVNLLIGKLNRKILSKDMSVGVLGIKSHFNGRVWDVGLEKFNFEYYTAGKEPVEFRPFYIFMIGKYTDIAHYYKMMNVNGLDSFPEKNFLIFSPQLVERLASFENSEIKRSKIKEVRNILRNNSINRHVKQFNVDNNSSKHYVDISIKLSFLDYIPNFNPQKLNLETTAWHWSEMPDNQQDNPKNNKKGKSVQKKKLVCSEKALRALTIKDIKLLDSQLKFRAAVYPKNFPADGTYCFKIVFRLPSESYSLPRWVFQWDMDQNLIYHWQQNPTQFQGNTTLNLKNFLNNIWQIIYQKHKPKIAKLYCYIKRG
ncbi:MAG: hypothetical protein PVH61_13460 [Candidatus Aminicenantes bacterium]